MKNQRNNELQVFRLDLSEILSGEQAALATHTRPTEAFAQTRSQRNIPRRPAGTQSVAKWLMAGSGDYKLRPRTSQPKRCAQHPTRSSGSAAAAKQICRRASCSSRSPESLLSYGNALFMTPRSAHQKRTLPGSHVAYQQITTDTAAHARVNSDRMAP